MPARSRVLLLPFVPGVAVLLIVLVTARAIVGVHRLLLLGVVPGLADVVPVSFSVTASIAGDSPCSRRPASVGVFWVVRALPGARRRCCSARVITARPLSLLLVIVGVSQAVASPAVQGGVGTPLFYLESTVLVVSDLALLAVPLNSSLWSVVSSDETLMPSRRSKSLELVSFKISVLSLYLWNVTISGRG